MESKNIKELNPIKISMFVLTVILFINMILNITVLYQDYSNYENSSMLLFSSVFGLLLGLIARGGLTLLFWGSYNIKYPNEKFNEKIGKKTIAYFLFKMSIMGFSLSNGMLLVFIICTLLVALKEQKKLDV